MHRLQYTHTHNSAMKSKPYHGNVNGSGQLVPIENGVGHFATQAPLINYPQFETNTCCCKTPILLVVWTHHGSWGNVETEEANKHRTYVHTHIRTYTHTHVRTHTHTYVHTRTHTHTCTRTHTHTQACTHTQTHIQTKRAVIMQSTTSYASSLGNAD